MSAPTNQDARELGLARSASLNAHLSLPTAIGMGAVVTVATLAFAVRRLASYSLKGDAV